MYVLAYISLHTSAAFDMLGGRPIYEWVLAAARQARGVDTIALVVSPDTRPLLLDNHGCEVIEMPDSASEQQITEMLIAADPRTVLVELHPGTVFLRPAAIEQAIAGVVNDGKPAAFTVLRADKALPDGGIPRPLGVSLLVPGCRVTIPGILGHGDFYAKGVCVPVTPFEVIDALTPDGARIAHALAETGRI